MAELSLSGSPGQQKGHQQNHRHGARPPVLRLWPALTPILLGLAFPALIVLLWWGVAQLELVSSRFLVDPVQVVAAAFTDPAGIQVWLATAQSLLRLLTGFLIGTVAGLCFGICTGTAFLADRALSPLLNALRQITLFAWIPLLTGWFGNGEGTRLAYIALSAFFPVAFGAHEAFRRIPASLIEAGATLRLRPLTRFRRLTVPAALPGICLGLQIGLISAWLGTISSEYAVGVSDGLGGLIVRGRETFRMDIVLLGVLALSLVGYLIGFLASRVRRALTRHHGLAA